MIAPVRPWI